jgi:hypothetical protein
VAKALHYAVKGHGRWAPSKALQQELVGNAISVLASPALHGSEFRKRSNAAACEHPLCSFARPGPRFRQNAWDSGTQNGVATNV